MPDCKACGMWFAAVGQHDLCPVCKRALERLNGYAAPLVRCKDCKNWHTMECALDYAMFEPTDDSFCSYGERKDGDTDGS